MCLATAYLSKGTEEPVLRDVARMRLNGDKVEMETLFGEEKVIAGSVLEVDFFSSKIIVDQYHSSATEGHLNKDDKA